MIFLFVKQIAQIRSKFKLSKRMGALIGTWMVFRTLAVYPSSGFWAWVWVLMGVLVGAGTAAWINSSGRNHTVDDIIKGWATIVPPTIAVGGLVMVTCTIPPHYHDLCASLLGLRRYNAVPCTALLLTE